MYIPRRLTRTLRDALAGFPGIVLTGPRQSGKTTLLRQEAGERVAYVSFDDPLARDFATVDPVGFLARFGEAPVILDEIQHVPGLLPHLKMRIDADPTRCGRWWLTGSQQFALMRGIGESLAGRVAVLELPPLSHAEWPRATLESTLWDGGYPVPALHPERRDLWLKSYVATYIERDVRQLRNIPDLRAFGHFLQLMAARHGQLFHPAELARDLGISQPTIKSWAGVLEASYVVRLLPPWFRNYGKRIVKAPKLHFLDSALVTMLTRQPDAAAALAGPLSGALLEGWVVSEATKAYLARGRVPDVHHWRSHDGLEVDLLLRAAGRLHAVEVKATATPGAGHTLPLDRFLKVAGDDAAPQGLVVCRTDRPRSLPGGHLALPWQDFAGWLDSQAL